MEDIIKTKKLDIYETKQLPAESKNSPNWLAKIRNEFNISFFDFCMELDIRKMNLTTNFLFERYEYFINNPAELKKLQGKYKQVHVKSNMQKLTKVVSRI